MVCVVVNDRGRTTNIIKEIAYMIVNAVYTLRIQAGKSHAW